MAAYAFQVVFAHGLLDLAAVAYADGKARAIFHHTAVIFNGDDIVSVQGNSFINEKKAWVMLGQLQKLRHGHAASRRSTVCQSDVEIVRVGDDGGDIR